MRRSYRVCVLILTGLLSAQCLPLLQGLQEDAAAGGELSGLFLAAMGAPGSASPEAETPLQLADIVLDEIAVDSVRLAPPATTSRQGAPEVFVWLGPDDSLRVDGPNVSGAAVGPIDVSSSGYEFRGLTTGGRYRIVVRARVGASYIVKQIVVVPGGSAPVLQPLRMSAVAPDRLVLERPSFSTAGSPAPVVSAYLGLAGSIRDDAGVIRDALVGPVDASAADASFAGLAAAREYRLLVVAENAYGRSVRAINQSTGSVTPALQPLVLAGADHSSITLRRPALSVAGNPAPNIRAFIGLNDSIRVAGDVVTGALAENIDVSAGDHQFRGLTPGTLYRIIVIASNAGGYHVQQIAQATDSFTPVAPELEDLRVSASDDQSIELAQPTFRIAGNPAPGVRAYIGLNGTISVSGANVTGALLGPINVSSGGHVFTGLTGDTAYRLIVVAENAGGASVREIIHSTGVLAPVLNPLVISNRTATSFTIERPGFAVNGNPTPTVLAWYGVDGQVYRENRSVFRALDYSVNITDSGHTFTGLDPAVTYRVIVIARGAQGTFSTLEIVQGPIAPVLNPLVFNVNATQVIVPVPTLAADSFPEPTIRGWVGRPGEMTLSGTTVENAVAGPLDLRYGLPRFQSLEPNSDYRLIVIAENSAGASIRDANLTTAPLSPDLNPLAIADSDGSSITLARPSYRRVPVPRGTLQAYIGRYGQIQHSVDQWDGVVVGHSAGPVDVSLGGTTFTGLEPNTDYVIIVIARNEAGFAAQLIRHSTTVLAPVLNDLSILSFDDDSLFLGRVSYATAGNPAPSEVAYLGVDGVIEINGSTVTNYLQRSFSGPANGWHAQGLDSFTTYRVVVVAENTGGHSVKQITQRTAGIAPELNPLRIQAAGPTGLQLSQPTLATAGSPTPTVRAYLGLANQISVSGSTVTNALTGPVDVSAGGNVFSGLDPAQLYRVVVVAENPAGRSVRARSAIVHRLYMKASNADAGDQYGSTIAVSGDYVAVGAPGEGSCTYGIDRDSADNACPGAGAVYVYRKQGDALVFDAYIKQPSRDVRENNDRFGASVALDGDLLVVGAPDEDSEVYTTSLAPGYRTVPTLNTREDLGAVYVYRRNAGTWEFEQMLKPIDPVHGVNHPRSNFGASVSASSGHIAVGAPGVSLRAGRVYTFRRQGSPLMWLQTGALMHSASYEHKCGTSVAVDADTLVFGCPFDRNPAILINSPESVSSGSAAYGSAYVYRWDGGAWNQEAYLKAYRRVRRFGSLILPDGRFGWSVDVSGDTVAVGAPHDLSPATGIDSLATGEDARSGSVFVFSRSGSTWSWGSHLKQDCEFGSAGQCRYTYLGNSVALAGDRLLVGMPGDYWSNSGLDSRLWPTTSREEHGAAVLFLRNGSSWRQEAHLTAPDPDLEDFFGTSVAVSDSGFFVSAIAEDSAAVGFGGDQGDNNATNSGALYWLR